jgi:hypothetical protein
LDLGDFYLWDLCKRIFFNSPNIVSVQIYSPIKLIESNFIEPANEIGRHKREIRTRRTLEFGNLVQSGTPTSADEDLIQRSLYD